MSTFDSSSKSSKSTDTEYLVFDFKFGLEENIQDLVRLGTLGQFNGARSLVDGYLGRLDSVFSIAIEIMRLMYDQEDFKGLHIYTAKLISRLNKRWTQRALCILRLMHDFCGMLLGFLPYFATKADDTFLANLGVRKTEQLNDEEIMITVLVLRIVYTTQMRIQVHPVVNRNTLPVALRQGKGLYAFVGILIHLENYWAADQVMKICLQLPTVDCAALWRSTERFLRGGSESDDEPKAYFRMSLMQTFMQGLLRIDPKGTSDRANAWSAFRSASQSLRPVLRTKLGDEDWLNSRGYWQGQVLELDEALSDGNPKVRQPALRQVQQLAPSLQEHAMWHGDRSLLETYRRQVAFLKQSKPQSPITQLEGASVVPFGGSANRNAPTVAKSRPIQQQSAPATKAGHRSDVAIRSGGPSSTASASSSTQQPWPPWQHSQSLGGFYLYKPSTDTIMLRDGRQYKRPDKIPVAALSSAVWEGPPTGMVQTNRGQIQAPSVPSYGQASRGEGTKSARSQALKPGQSSHRGEGSTRTRGRADENRSGRGYEAGQSDQSEDDDDDEEEEDDDDGDDEDDDGDEDEDEDAV